jgi:hypothetical protein
MANTPFDGTLQQSLRLDRTILDNDGFGKMSVTWGELELLNADGQYDELAQSYAIDGRPILIKVGTMDRPYDRFYTVFRGTATGWSIEEDVVRITLRDNGYRLEVPASPNLYAGTGGLAGGSDLTGKRKPLCFGYADNVSPPLVIPLELVYQVHDGRCQAVSAVYDRGSVLTPDGDVPTADALRAAAIAPGHFLSCVAEGYMRLGGMPVGDVTADVQGDATGGVFVSKTAGVIRRLLSRAAGIQDPGELVVSSFTDLDTLQPADVGYWVAPDSAQTVREIADLLLGGIGAWGDFRRDGLFRVARFDAPAGAPSGRYSEVEIGNIARLALPARVSPPPWRFRVAWGRNWTVQTDLAGAVGAARVAYLAQEFRTAASSYTALATQIRTTHPLAQDPDPVSSYFRLQGPASDEADRLLLLYSTTRSLYQITLGLEPYIFDIGDMIFVTYPRWDLVDGKLLRIVAMSEDPDQGQVEVTAFG